MKSAALHEEILELRFKLEKQKENSQKLLRKQQTLVNKIEKLEWISHTLSTVYSLTSENSAAAIAFQRHLFSDEELDLATAVAFVDSVKRYLDQTQKHAKAIS
jgi:hypothetical protein